jgi:hypothetical protein
MRKVIGIEIGSEFHTIENKDGYHYHQSTTRYAGNEVIFTCEDGRRYSTKMILERIEKKEDNANN